MDNEKIEIQSKEAYSHIRKSLIAAQTKVTSVINAAMVQAYWEIGEAFQIRDG